MLLLVLSLALEMLRAPFQSFPTPEAHRVQWTQKEMRFETRKMLQTKKVPDFLYPKKLQRKVSCAAERKSQASPRAQPKAPQSGQQCNLL